jgi:DNA topoisomerase-3
MRLIIAEKPSVAQAIAGVIGGAKRSDGFIDCPQAKHGGLR